MKTKLFLGLVLGTLLILPSFCGAETVEIPNPIKPNNITELINIIAGILQAVAVSVGVVMIIIAGIQYTTSAGDDEKAGKAKKTIRYTLIGVAIVLASSFIVQLVTEILGKIK